MTLEDLADVANSLTRFLRLISKKSEEKSKSLLIKEFRTVLMEMYNTTPEELRIKIVELKGDFNGSGKAVVASLSEKEGFPPPINAKVLLSKRWYSFEENEVLHIPKCTPYRLKIEGKEGRLFFLLVQEQTDNDDHPISQ